MTYLTQKTIKNKISFSGVGLHTGVKVNVCIKPAQPDTGIVFKRIDLVKNNYEIGVYVLSKKLDEELFLIGAKFEKTHF